MRFVIAALAAACVLYAGQALAIEASGPREQPGVRAEKAVEEFSARRRHHRSHRHRWARHGACDGFHGCRCGVTAARRHGLPLVYRGHNLKQAVEYIRAFPRIASPVPGAIGYQRTGGPTGHVFTVEALTGDRCVVRVSDDRGTYDRNVCRYRAVYVQVTG